MDKSEGRGIRILNTIMFILIALYNVSIYLYTTGIKIAALFNTKAKLWIRGRQQALPDTKKELNEKKSTVVHVWIHVASLGEFEQGRPLIEALKQKNERYRIILTFFSPSGYEIRKNYPFADYILYLPIDTPANANRFLDSLKPDLAIFVKYEFWYHYLKALKKRAIPTILISAIFTEKQLSDCNPYNLLLKEMLFCFDSIFVQTPPSVSLLENMGLQNIYLAGDTRVDRVIAIAKEAKTYPIIEQFKEQSPILICGSTWQIDEEILLQIFKSPNFNQYKFILAPHDISEKNIDRLIQMLPEKSLRYSNILNKVDESKSDTISDIRILIIDNIGTLSSIYRYGKVAYIGGGFGKGIHNTLEPIAFGLPVIFGKKYKKFAEAIALVETEGGFSITDFETFEEKMLYLNNEKNYLHASKAAKHYLDSNKGATEKIMHYIENRFLIE